MAEVYPQLTTSPEQSPANPEEGASLTPLRLSRRALDLYGVTDHPVTFYPLEVPFAEIIQMEIDAILAPFRHTENRKWVAVALFYQRRCNNQLANNVPTEQMIAELKTAVDPLYDVMRSDHSVAPTE